MPRVRKYALSDLPDAGTVFAMPLRDGRVGICRVIHKTGDTKIPCVLVATSDWIAGEPPPLNHPAVRRILILNHHKWRNHPEMLWCVRPPSREFRELGKIEVHPDDENLASGHYGDWSLLPGQVLAQWRWDHDREAVLVEDAAQKRIEGEQRAQDSRNRTAYLSSVSLDDLLTMDLFPTWRDYPSKKAKDGCQNIIRSLILTLHGAQEPLSVDFVTTKLRECVEQLNRFDKEHKNFIETVERENVFGVLEEVINAAKCSSLVRKIDEWRDW